jgi:hypothetical protein
MLYTLPYFGEIDLISESSYDATTEFESRKVRLDLNLDRKPVDIAKLSYVKSCLDDLPNIISMARKAIRADFDNDGIAKDYITQHLEQFDEATLVDLFQGTEAIVAPTEKLFTKIHFKRIGFYPDSGTHSTVIDFTVGRDYTQYLIVVFMDDRGNISSVDMES